MNDRHSTSWQALAIWCGGQFLVLLLSACRVPLSAHPAEPPEVLAPNLLIATQFVLSTLLYPALLNDVRSTVLSIVFAVPMLLLSGTLSDTKSTLILSLVGVLALWILSLTVWSRSLRRDGPARAFRLVALSIVLGGPMLQYVAAEFGPHSLPSASQNYSHFPPLFGPLAVLFEGRTGFSAWIVLFAFLLGGVAVRLIRTRWN